MAELELFGRLGRHPARPERLAIMAPNGTISNWLAVDDTEDTARELLASRGLRLADNGDIFAERAAAP